MCLGQPLFPQRAGAHQLPRCGGESRIFAPPPTPFPPPPARPRASSDPPGLGTSAFYLEAKAGLPFLASLISLVVCVSISLDTTSTIS